ncbi:cell wall surface anchor family protein [Streptococcus suis]|uniref:isopeptide-forming domain-containing fimbrial protein n=5 Tax=Streptococcus suis TaxID=1307 RepID=UPI000420C650|nr:pilin N-terminal domain-containing protein [Streptococcus suis]VTT12960.1 cell wall surface anchor family protein [Streptococcus suis]HEM3201077.1 isopeptide-forming domain-containing fimbrial protein [Streptococcus suis]HEM4240520.1 isopeptide-forming domain-containing fimbrial protein [Streptococcus suis]HEM5403916.1 isopeptide-forming domain-containing fimbrial protein [Streptococcus suis]
MKKLTKLFSVFTVFLTVLGSLINIKHLVHAEDTASTTVIVHKIVMNNDDFNKFTYEENLSKYNGNSIGDLKNYFGNSAVEVAGVKFDVWKKTDVVAPEAKTGAELGITGDTNKYVKTDKTAMTQDNGATFTLANGIYIFTEDKGNSPYYNNQNELTGMKAVPFKLELPQAKTDGSGYFDTKTPLHVYPKNTENKPEITKEFTDKRTNVDQDGIKNVEIGQEIGYTITTKVPKDAAYKTFAWEDTMLKGLDFKLDSLQIADDKGLNLQKITDYTLTQTVRGFMVKLTNTGLSKLETAAKAGDVNFTVTYTAILNDSAVVDTKIPNQVKLIYGNRPSEFSEPKSTTPKDGEITVEKTWGEGVNKTDVVFGVYEEATGVKVGTVTLYANQVSATSSLKLKEGVKYIVIEETIVSGSLPSYTNGAQGTIKVKNNENPNPDPLVPEDPEVVTYGKRFVKTDDKDLDSSKKLLGAEFIVRKDGEESYLALKDTVTQAKEIADYKAAEADYLATVKSATTDNPKTDEIKQKKDARDTAYEKMNMQWTWVGTKEGAFTFVSSTDGKFEVKGLKEGKYELIETKAPEGFALPTSPVEFTVGAHTWGTIDALTADNFQQIKNKKVTIPQTGGIGTLVFTIVGLSTMVFAFIAMKKRQSEEA